MTLQPVPVFPSQLSYTHTPPSTTFSKKLYPFLVTAANLQKQSHKAGMDLQIRLQPEPAVFF